MTVSLLLEMNVGLTAVSRSEMKTVHPCACMKDKMVATVFLSRTSSDCCSSKIRLARSNNTYNTKHIIIIIVIKLLHHRIHPFILHTDVRDSAHLVSSVLQLGCFIELGVVKHYAGESQVRRKFLSRRNATFTASVKQVLTYLTEISHLLVLLCERAVVSTSLIDRLCDTDDLRNISNKTKTERKSII